MVVVSDGGGGWLTEAVEKGAVEKKGAMEKKGGG